MCPCITVLFLLQIQKRLKLPIGIQTSLMTTVLFFRSDHSDFVDYRMLSLLPALLPASLRWAAHPPSLLCLLSPSLSEIVLGKSHHRSQHSPFVRLLKSIMKSGRCFWSHTQRQTDRKTPLSRNCQNNTICSLQVVCGLNHYNINNIGKQHWQISTQYSSVLPQVPNQIY